MQHFFIYLFHPDLIELVHGHGNVPEICCLTDHFGNASKYFSVVQFYNGIDVQAGEYLIDDLYQFHLIQQRITANNINITLEKLPVASALWAVGTPNRLNLVTFEREVDLIAVLHHVSGKWDGKVISQSLFCNL